VTLLALRRRDAPAGSIARIAGSRRLGVKSGARRRNHRAASGGGRRSAWRRRRRPNRPRLEPFRARWPVFKGLRDDFPPRPRVAGLGRQPTPARQGTERPIAATPSFSQDFQTFPRKFQGNSLDFQTFPRISKFFPWPFRGKSRGCRSLEPETRFLPFSRRLGRDERPGAAPPNPPARFTIARIPIIGKKLSRQFSGRGLRASAAYAPTRKPTAATPAPCGFGGERRRGRGGPVEKVRRRPRAAKFGNSHPVRKHRRHSVEHGTSAMRRMAERFPARGLAVNFELIRHLKELIHHLKERTLILFRRGVR